MFFSPLIGCACNRSAPLAKRGGKPSRPRAAEGQATNLTLYSQQLNFNDGTTGWSPDGIGITADATTAPDGTTSADKLFETATTQQRNLGSRGTWQVPPSDAVISAYVKAAEKDRVIIGAKSGGVIAGGVVINLNDGSQQGTWARSPGNIVCQRMLARPLANAWWHVQVFCRNATDQAAGMGALISLTNITSGSVGNESYLGDGVSGVYVWGVQMEERAEDLAGYGTSYIPTTNVAVTRNADAMKLDADGWFNHEEGTFIFSNETIAELGITSRQCPIAMAGGTDNDTFKEWQQLDGRLNVSYTGSMGALAGYEDVTFSSVIGAAR